MRDRGESALTDSVEYWMHFFYYHSVLLLSLTAVIFIALWGLLEYYLYKKEKLYRTVNIILFAASIYVVLRCTVLFRQTGEFGVSLIPFETLVRAFGEAAFFRTLLLNLLLFMPLTLFGCSAFNCTDKKRALILIVSGAVFSVVIEIMQYLLCVGQAEIDDVICNTLGLIIGYLIYREHYCRFLKKS